MKRIGLSLAVIAMMATAAQAEIKNESFTGSASLFYDTTDAADLFARESSSGNVGIKLDGVASVGGCDTCTKLNYGVTGISTMGLEDTLVSTTWEGQSVNGSDLNINDGVWIDTLNLQFNPLDGISNTTMIVGRQSLDTPMVFTETWSIAKNTFDAAVAVNTDIKDVTLVGAWVGRSNGANAAIVNGGLDTRTLGLTTAGVVTSDGISDNAYGRFITSEGAFAFGAVTSLIPMVTAQAWYYKAPSFADLAWIQADGEYMGFGLGAQYIYTDAQDAGFADTGSAYAVKIGYNLEGLGLSAAYSDVDDSSIVGNLDGAQSKLYTEAWWMYGQVSAPDTESFNVTATYSMANVADFGIYYTNADHANTPDLQEVTVTAGKSFGNLDASLAYINVDIDDGSDALNEIQVYLTYNF